MDFSTYLWKSETIGKQIFFKKFLTRYRCHSERKDGPRGTRIFKILI